MVTATSPKLKNLVSYDDGRPTYSKQCLAHNSTAIYPILVQFV